MIVVALLATLTLAQTLITPNAMSCVVSKNYPNPKIPVPVISINATSLTVEVSACGITSSKAYVAMALAKGVIDLPIPLKQLHYKFPCGTITVKLLSPNGHVVEEKKIAFNLNVVDSEMPFMQCSASSEFSSLTLNTTADLQSYLASAYQQTPMKVQLYVNSLKKSNVIVKLSGAVAQSAAPTVGVAFVSQNLVRLAGVSGLKQVTLYVVPQGAVSTVQALADNGAFAYLSINANYTDPDHDGIPSGLELTKYHTNPLSNDTDHDGLTDYQEIFKYHTNPLKKDTDGDGLTDYQEVMVYHTNPLKKDTDGDGLTDYQEVVVYHTNPLKKDTDGDGLTDYQEVMVYHTNPLVKDTDHDGLTDYQEVKIYHTNPLNPDTDGDGLTDGQDV
jgi:hypothetical protein